MKNLVILLCSLCLALPAWAEPGAEQASLQQQWQAWYSRSTELRRLDQRALAHELSTVGKPKPFKPARHDRFGFDPAQPVAFYKTPAGQRIADIVLSYQTPSGGWSKRVDMSLRPRAKGEAWGAEKGYQPTFDNYATSTQMRLLARAYAATGQEKYRAGLERGLKLVLAAQMPNGGWPQSYPLDGGYHDLITFNDKCMVNLLELLRSVTDGEPGYETLAPGLKAAAADALLRGINLILMSQYQHQGQFSIWPAQLDPFSLAPAPARAFEPAALASQESAEILLFLMSLPKPPAVVVQAVDDAMAWLTAHQISGWHWDKHAGRLVADEVAKPIWARFYDPVSQEPVFGDRDGKVYGRVDQISEERRLGYAWYSNGPAKLTKKYREWRKLNKNTP